MFFFLPCGFSFFLDVNSFAVTVCWATVPLKFCSRRFLMFFQHVGIREQNFKGTAVAGKELNLGQKEKPHGKKKKTHGKKNSLTAKEKRIKNALSASKKFCRESFFFLL